MRKRIHFFTRSSFVFLFFLLYPPQGYCQPFITYTKKYYDISGTSAVELRQSLDQNSPVIIAGKSYDAYTQWHVSWSFNTTRHKTFCFIGKVSTTLVITQTYPRVVSPMPIQLQRKWKKYLTALQSHENGHEQIGIQAAEAVESKLSSLPPGSSCSELENSASLLGKRIIQDFIERERIFDHNTNYGANEGAVFP